MNTAPTSVPRRFKRSSVSMAFGKKQFNRAFGETVYRKLSGEPSSWDMLSSSKSKKQTDFMNEMEETQVLKSEFPSS